MLRCLQIGYNAILAVINHFVVNVSLIEQMTFLHWYVLTVDNEEF